MKPALKSAGIVAPIALAPLALMRAGEALLATPPEWESAGAAVLLLAVLGGWFYFTARNPNVETGIETFDKDND